MFKKDLEKIWVEPEQLNLHGNSLVEKKLKPNLQKVLDAILDEDTEMRITKTVGECLEYILQHSILMELVAFGKSDRPQGLFEMVLKFINFIIFDIQATPLLNQQHVYPAIMQLLVHIEYSLKNNMLIISKDQQYEEDDFKYIESSQVSIRGKIIDFLRTLTYKCSELPSMATFLFSDSRAGYRKGSYIPISILLLLLIKEDLRE